jgi:hypothetical protein
VNNNQAMPNGIPADAPLGEPVDFVGEAEPWCRYRLEDGTVVRIRILLTRAQPILGMTNPDGTQIYALSWQTVMDCASPLPHTCGKTDHLDKRNP